MTDPLIPYVTIPELRLSFLEHVPLLGRLIDAAYPPSLHPFGVLVALGVYLGAGLAVRHARERGLDTRKMNDLILWTVGCGFVAGHVLDAVFYHPDEVARNPLHLLALWRGLSSFGGFVGAVAGGLAWSRYRRESLLPYADVICSAFPLAWVFGRAGCSVVHDHPGRISAAWFAVRYPMLPEHLGRFDLGLYECVLTVPLAAAFAVLWWRGPRRTGFYIGQGIRPKWESWSVFNRSGEKSSPNRGGSDDLRRRWPNSLSDGCACRTRRFDSSSIFSAKRRGAESPAPTRGMRGSHPRSGRALRSWAWASTS